MVRNGPLVPGDLVRVVGGKHMGKSAKFVDCCHSGKGIKGVFCVMGDTSKSESKIEYRLVEQEIQDSLKNEKAEKEEALRILLLEARCMQIQMANLVRKIEALCV
jgi:ribosomal protein L24